MSASKEQLDVFDARLSSLTRAHDELLSRRNAPTAYGNGVYQRWNNPVLTRDHVPLTWRYDFDRAANPFFMERLGVNAVFNAGAIFLNGQFNLIARIEGKDRKSFFGVASSDNGIDNFRFQDTPLVMPETSVRDTNVYDMRVTRHEDGWIYGLFCTERPDTSRPGEISAATAQCGIARTKDLINWERLPDLTTPSPQQRNVVLHPELVDGRYGFYTRPQGDFLGTGGAGLGWGTSNRIENAAIDAERTVDERVFHTVKELKNGQGPAPIKSECGWLHLAHGVRNTCAGYRYVLYMFVTDLDEPWRVTHRPGGYLIAPEGPERVGDVSNVAFCNGWINTDDGRVCIYYASSDTRMHVATSSVAQLVDYVTNTPEDPLFSADCVAQRLDLINKNKNHV